MTFSLVSCNITGGATGKRTTITAAEWDNLNSITNYTLHFVAKTTGSGGNPIIAERVIKCTNNAIYYKSSQNSISIENSYKINDDGQQYMLMQQRGGAWVATPYSWEPESMIEYLGFIPGLQFGDLVYNTASRAYEYILEDEGLVGIISYYFENGMLVKVTAYTYEAEGVAAANSSNCVETIDAVFSDVGATEIKVPQYTVSQD